MRSRQAIGPRSVTKANTRSVVATSRREADALRLVGVEQTRGGACVEHGGELPRQVHGVADASVHPLAADRAVDVGGVSQQERAPLPESRRHPVVHVIGREPVHPVDRELQMPDHAIADFVESQVAVFIGRPLDHGSNEAHPTRSLQRKDSQEVGPAEIDMDFPVRRRAGPFHVGDVENVGVGPARESDRKRLPDGRMRAVAACEIGCLADLLWALGVPERRAHAVPLLIETDELGTALHRHSQQIEPFDQHALVSVLREDKREGERGQLLAHAIQGQPCDLGALNPEVRPRNLDAAVDERVGHPKLAVELQRASRDGQGTRGGSRLSGLVEDPHGDAEPGQPEREHETGGAGAGDQDLDVGPRSLNQRLAWRRMGHDRSLVRSNEQKQGRFVDEVTEFGWRRFAPHDAWPPPRPPCAAT